MNRSKFFHTIAIGLLLSFSTANAEIRHKSCFTGSTGLLIPERHGFTQSGLSEEEYHRVIDQVLGIYEPIFAQKGLQLKAKRDWADSTVNASAWLNEALTQMRSISFTGGLARHPLMTKEVFATVICHEIGHHLGGTPKKENLYLGLISLEGQADYYATLKCLRKVYAGENNVEALQGREVPEAVKAQCAESFAGEAEAALCIRLSLAGRQTALFSAEMERQRFKRQVADPRFSTPSAQVVGQTLTSHPPAQCRLDTFFQGALCHVQDTVELADDDPDRGACSERMGDTRGLRPRCWYQPEPSILLSFH